MILLLGVIDYKGRIFINEIVLISIETIASPYLD